MQRHTSAVGFAGFAMLLAGCASASGVVAGSGGPTNGSTCQPASNWMSTPATSAGDVSSKPSGSESRPPSFPQPAVVSAPPTTTSSFPGFPADDSRVLTLDNACSSLQAEIAYVSIAVAPDATSSSGGAEFEVATVWLAVAGLPLQYSRSDFRFTGHDHRVYQPTTPNPSPNGLPPVGSGTMGNGGKVIGVVVFEVPPGGGTITYTNELTGGTASWITTT